MTKKTHPLKPVLSYPNKVIDCFCLQINQQLAILGRIRAALPEELASHALHCVVNDKKLVVYTDSANWATQLRFYGKAMIAAIGTAHSKPVCAIHVKITEVSAFATTSSKRSEAIPSQTVRDEIHNQSLITTDPELKQALDKLSSTLDRLQVRK